MFNEVQLLVFFDMENQGHVDPKTPNPKMPNVKMIWKGE